MHETRRFALALAGIGGCLGIAAGIVVTGVADVPVVPVARLPTPRAVQTLPRLPMPSWSDVTSDIATARATRKVRTAATESSMATSGSGVAMTAAAPRVDRVGPSSIATREPSVARPLDARPVPLILIGAPQATGGDVVVAESRAREHDAVTGAFVTAGSHVGKSFRTVGRTLKRVF